MDRMSTVPVPLAGGLIQNISPLAQQEQLPGSATELVNYEVSLRGGYRRIDGFTQHPAGLVPAEKWDGISADIPLDISDDQTIKGLRIFENEIFAARGGYIYKSAIDGLSWTKVNSGLPIDVTLGRVRMYSSTFTGVDTLYACSGERKPMKYTTAGGAFTEIAAATGNYKVCTEFANHMFYAGHSVDGEVVFTAPNTDDNFGAGAGAGSFNVGDTVMFMIAWRDQLIIFCQSSIHRLTGTSSADFVRKPITTKLGALSEDCVLEVGTDIYYLAPDGIRTIAGTDRIGDFNLEQQSAPVFKDMEDYIKLTDMKVMWSVPSKSQLRLSGYNEGEDANIRTGFIGTLFADGHWEWSKLQGMPVSAACSGYIFGLEYVFHGSDTGYVYQQEFGDTFDGTDIYWRYQSPYMAFSEIRRRKHMQKLRAYMDFEGTLDMTVAFKYNLGDSSKINPNPIAVSFLNGEDSTYGSAATLFDTNDLYDPFLYPGFDVNIMGSGENVSIVLTGTGGAAHTIYALAYSFILGGLR